MPHTKHNANTPYRYNKKMLTSCENIETQIIGTSGRAEHLLVRFRPFLKEIGRSLVQLKSSYEVSSFKICLL